ncbi:substrate-binding domain-containing protein [uncultured Sphingomonas sp.]|uniref:substrate-binding domain-containing protein n=1 Tax=uncultured Sphingomonas sp. TaxID=158754 RepID=UPI0035CA2A17
MFRTIALIALAAIPLAACTDQAGNDGATRDQISVVGSSTVFPFTTMVAEQFVAKTPGAKAPVIESTGTGGGMSLFCKGVGGQFPDIEDASRRMKAGEYAMCKTNGVTDIMEVQIGIDGIAFAEAASGPKLQLTPADVFKALAATPMNQKNQAKTWKDVNPALPATPIQVYGPPSTSGTRDALAELILAKGCEALMPAMVQMKASSPDGYKTICTRIRDDGVYIDAGENDNLIVQKLQANPNAVGIFGYSYLQENKGRLTGVPLNGIEPTYETISSGAYPGARPLYLYVKKAHLAAIPNLGAFLQVYAEAWAPDGPLVKRGLIAAPADIRAKSAAIIKDGTILDPAILR